jgi:hypothetical protein
MNADKVVAAINSTKIAEVIKVMEGPTSVQIIHRVLPKQLLTWLGVLEFVLSRKQGWEEHVCKRYFYQGGKIRYAWNFIIQWKSPKQKEEVLTQVVRNMQQAANTVPQSFHQLDSYPLAGAKDGRNVPAGPWNPRAAGPMTGGLSQKGAHKL